MIFVSYIHSYSNVCVMNHWVVLLQEKRKTNKLKSPTWENEKSLPTNPPNQTQNMSLNFQIYPSPALSNHLQPGQQKTALHLASITIALSLISGSSTFICIALPTQSSFHTQSKSISYGFHFQALSFKFCSFCKCVQPHHQIFRAAHVLCWSAQNDAHLCSPAFIFKVGCAQQPPHQGFFGVSTRNLKSVLFMFFRRGSSKLGFFMAVDWFVTFSL